MRPEIDAYLRSNGAKYTTKALRAQLIHAGHDPGEVDAAPDALTGTLRFEGLASEPLEGPGEQPTPEEISGSVNWNCE